MRFQVIARTEGAKPSKDGDEPQFWSGEAMGGVSLKQIPPTTAGEDEHGRVDQLLEDPDPGPVEDTTQLELLLAAIWDNLGGHGGGRTGHKLLGRWKPSSGTHPC